MPNNPKAIRWGRVTTEGDELHYEVRGQGQPLLLIPGAGGDADGFAAIADILAVEFKVITYDRRANARSTMNDPQSFTVGQQSRDAVAVLHAAGEESAFVAGNSSGAVIALDMATTQPQAVRAAIVHEAPLARLHPQAARWQRFFASAYRTGFRLGSGLAALRFLLGIQLPVRALIRAQAQAAAYARSHGAPEEEPRIDRRAASDVLVKQELLPVTDYGPDIERLRRNGVRVVVAVGEWGLQRHAWYVQVARTLAAELGGELAVFPGHHGSYMDMPDAWAAALRRVLYKAGGTSR